MKCSTGTCTTCWGGEPGALCFYCLRERCRLAFVNMGIRRLGCPNITVITGNVLWTEEVLLLSVVFWGTEAKIRMKMVITSAQLPTPCPHQNMFSWRYSPLRAIATVNSPQTLYFAAPAWLCSFAQQHAWIMIHVRPDRSGRRRSWISETSSMTSQGCFATWQ